jgi:hypothetical protein
VARASGRQVATAPRADRADPAAKPDWEQGYGYQFWRSRHGYRGDGAFGQFCLVLPAQDAVVAITAQTPDMQAMLSAVWAHLLPALGGRGGASTTADARLEARLHGLSTAVAPGRDSPPDGPGGWDGAHFVPRAGRRQPGSGLSGLGLHRTDGRWRVRLEDGAWQLEVDLRTGGWGAAVPLSEAVACTGGWTDATTLRVDAVFVDTPHRLALTCHLDDGSLEPQWATAPLHDPALSQLRAPSPAIG